MTSSAAKPLVTTRSPSTTGPSVTYFGLATLSSSTRYTNLRTCSVPIAESGTSSAVAGAELGDLDATEHAGRELAVGVRELGTTADRARGTIDGVVDEIDLALVREVLLVDAA